MHEGHNMYALFISASPHAKRCRNSQRLCLLPSALNRPVPVRNDVRPGIRCLLLYTY